MAPHMAPHDALDKISAWLADLYGPRLISLVVYGSFANGHQHNHDPKHSDINLLAVLDTVDAHALDQGEPALAWWIKQGYPPVALLSRDEQADSADVFPIEYLDIHAHHRLLKGDDLFGQAPQLPELHRRQVEHDLRAKLLRLRAAYIGSSRDAKALERVLLDSVSTFLTLFRHALAAVGQPFLVDKEKVLAAAAAHFHFDAAPFTAILQSRRLPSRLEGGKLEPLRALFARYLAALSQVERALEAHPHSHA